MSIYMGELGIMPINKETLSKYKSSDVFIETGSYIGEGIDIALECGYKVIYSIELSEHYYNHCLEKYKNNYSVNLILGDSEIELPKLISSINKKCDIWLDAHYSMGNTAMGTKICPLNEELNSILNTNFNHTILIDDVRFMDTEWRNNIKKDEIIKLIKHKHNYEISYEDGYVNNDILVAKVK